MGKLSTDVVAGSGSLGPGARDRTRTIGPLWSFTTPSGSTRPSAGSTRERQKCRALCDISRFSTGRSFGNPRCLNGRGWKRGEPRARETCGENLTPTASKTWGEPRAHGSGENLTPAQRVGRTSRPTLVRRRILGLEKSRGFGIKSQGAGVDAEAENDHETAARRLAERETGKVGSGRRNPDHIAAPLQSLTMDDAGF